MDATDFPSLSFSYVAEIKKIFDRKLFIFFIFAYLSQILCLYQIRVVSLLIFFQSSEAIHLNCKTFSEQLGTRLCTCYWFLSGNDFLLCNGYQTYRRGRYSMPTVDCNRLQNAIRVFFLFQFTILLDLVARKLLFERRTRYCVTVH